MDLGYFQRWYGAFALFLVQRWWPFCYVVAAVLGVSREFGHSFSAEGLASGLEVLVKDALVIGSWSGRFVFFYLLFENEIESPVLDGVESKNHVCRWSGSPIFVHANFVDVTDITRYTGIERLVLVLTNSFDQFLFCLCEEGSIRCAHLADHTAK